MTLVVWNQDQCAVDRKMTGSAGMLIKDQSKILARNDHHIVTGLGASRIVRALFDWWREQPGDSVPWPGDKAGNELATLVIFYRDRIVQIGSDSPYEVEVRYDELAAGFAIGEGEEFAQGMLAADADLHSIFEEVAKRYYGVGKKPEIFNTDELKLNKGVT